MMMMHRRKDTKGPRVAPSPTKGATMKDDLYSPQSMISTGSSARQVKDAKARPMLNSMSDFGLPDWEHPEAKDVTRSMSDFGLQDWEHPEAKDVTRLDAMVVASPIKTQQPQLYPTSSGYASPPSHQNPENMLVVFTDSFSSLGDDITLGDFSGYDAIPEKRNTLSHSTHSHRLPARATCQTIISDEDRTMDMLTAEQAQEEELILLAMENSVADLGSSNASPIRHRRTTSDSMTDQGSRMSSPRRSAQSDMANFRSRMSSNQRVMCMDHSSREARILSEQKSDGGMNSVGGGSSANSRQLGTLSGRIQTDARTGVPFIWKKGQNNRYMKVPVRDLNPYGRARPTTSTDTSAAAAAALQYLEQKMLEEAMNLSLSESLLHSSPGRPTTEEERREQEMIELAMERSLQETSMRSAPRRFNSGHFGGTNARPILPPLSRRRSSLSSCQNGDTGAPPADCEQFIWKKAPNNKYYKVYRDSVDDQPPSA
jgi:hypothetical protein